MGYNKKSLNEIKKEFLNKFDPTNQNAGKEITDIEIEYLIHDLNHHFDIANAILYIKNNILSGSHCESQLISYESTCLFCLCKEIKKLELNPFRRYSLIMQRLENLSSFIDDIHFKHPKLRSKYICNNCYHNYKFSQSSFFGVSPFNATNYGSPSPAEKIQGIFEDLITESKAGYTEKFKSIYELINADWWLDFVNPVIDYSIAEYAIFIFQRGPNMLYCHYQNEQITTPSPLGLPGVKTLSVTHLVISSFNQPGVIEINNNDFKHLKEIVMFLSQIPSSSRTYDSVTKIWTIPTVKFDVLKKLYIKIGLLPDKRFISHKSLINFVNGTSIDFNSQSSVLDAEEFFYGGTQEQTAGFNELMPLATVEAKLKEFLGTSDITRKAYFKASMRLHPDKGTDGKEFAELNMYWQQYEVLTGAKKQFTLQDN